MTMTLRSWPWRGGVGPEAPFPFGPVHSLYPIPSVDRKAWVFNPSFSLSLRFVCPVGVRGGVLRSVQYMKVLLTSGQYIDQHHQAASPQRLSCLFLLGAKQQLGQQSRSCSGPVSDHGGDPSSTPLSIIPSSTLFARSASSSG